MALLWIFMGVLAIGIGMGVWALVAPGGDGRARAILSERLARGELTPDEYRERVSVLGPPGAPTRRLFISVGAGLIAVGLIGAVTSAAVAMGCGEMGWMTRGMPMMDGMGGMMAGGMMAGAMMAGGMMGGDTGRRGDAPKEGATERDIEARDFSFKPPTIRIPVDETVNVSLRNTGASYHTFTVRDLDFELRAEPDDKISGAIRASEPGRYRAVCMVPGHERMGMTATVVVDD